MPYNMNMTAEMIREETAPMLEETLPRNEEPTSCQRPVRNPGALATQEQLDGLARLLAWFEEKNGPVTDEMREKVCADLAAADAEIGYIR